MPARSSTPATTTTNRQADRIDWEFDPDETARRLFYSAEYRRTNRAIFLKMQYLFRY